MIGRGFPITDRPHACPRQFSPIQDAAFLLLLLYCFLLPAHTWLLVNSFPTRLHLYILLAPSGAPSALLGRVPNRFGSFFGLIRSSAQGSPGFLGEEATSSRGGQNKDIQLLFSHMQIGEVRKFSTLFLPSGRCHVLNDPK